MASDLDKLWNKSDSPGVYLRSFSVLSILFYVFHSNITTSCSNAHCVYLIFLLNISTSCSNAHYMSIRYCSIHHLFHVHLFDISSALHHVILIINVTTVRVLAITAYFGIDVHILVILGSFCLFLILLGTSSLVTLIPLSILILEFCL